MDENKLEIGAIVSLDLNPLEQELAKAEQLLQGFAQRSAAIGDSTPDRPVVQSSSDGSAPIAPLPQPAPLRMPSDEVLRNMPQPPPSSLPQVPQAAQDAQLTQMRAEMEMIRSFAKSSPDIALHALAGRGGLAQRALRSGVEAGGDSAPEFQELINSLKELTTEARKGSSSGKDDGSPLGAAIGLMKANALMGAAMGTFAQAASGNVFGAGGSALGAGIGLMAGGAVGAGIGQAIGGTVGGGVDFLAGLGKAGVTEEKSRTDIAARFGDFGELKGNLGFQSIAGMDRSGYSQEDILGLIDQLRSRRAIDDRFDGEDKALVESLQEMSRALGINTSALAENYATYKNLGGQQSATDYQADIVAQAASVGMRANIEQYQSLNTSASQQLALSSVQGLGEGGTRSLAGLLKSVLGGDSERSRMLRDNAGLAQGTVSEFLSKGSTTAFTTGDVMASIAGASATERNAILQTPEERIRTAALQYGAVAKNTLSPGAFDEIKGNLSSNPNAVKDYFRDNPQAMTQLNMAHQMQFGKLPTEATEGAALFGTIENMAKNGGQIVLDSASDEGSFAKTLASAGKTEAQIAREAEAKAADERLKAEKELMELSTANAKMQAEMWQSIGPIFREINKLAGELKPAFDAVKPWVDKLAGLASPVMAPSQMIASASKIGDAIKSDPLGSAGKVGMTLLEQSPLFKQAQRMTGHRNDGGNIFGDVAANAGDALKFGINPIKGLFDTSGEFLKDALPKFRDTPGGGIVAGGPMGNSFTFADGDLIFASASAASAPGYAGITTGDDMRGGGGLNFAPVINIHAAPGTDTNAVEQAVQRGLRSGTDDFIDQWRSARRGNAGGRSSQDFG
jgi:hypothetical protein